MDPHDFLLSREQLQEILKNSFDEDGECESIFDKSVVGIYFTPVSMLRDIMSQPIYNQYLFKRYPGESHVHGVMCYLTTAGSSKTHYYIVDCIQICGTVQYILYCVQYDDNGDVSLVDGLSSIKIFVKPTAIAYGKWVMSFPVESGVIGNVLYSGNSVTIMVYIGKSPIGELYEGYQDGVFSQLTIDRSSKSYTFNTNSLKALGITDTHNMSNFELTMLLSYMDDA